MHSVITIDGPAASGKSSVSRELAKQLGWKWLSTGAFYRGLAYAALKEGVDLTDTKALVRLCRDELWQVQMAPEKTLVFYRGEDVTELVQKEEIGNTASQISPFPEVRQALIEAQRDCARQGGLVAEGRDCGTVIFPDAPLKIFLTANSSHRAARRALEQGRSMADTAEEQRRRDSQDSQRTTAPLQVPENGHVIDTSTLSLPEVVSEVLNLARRLV